MRRLLVVAVLALAACSSEEPPVVTAADIAPEPTVVELHLGGSAEAADVTVMTPGGTRQQTGVSLPLTNRAGTQGLHLEVLPGDIVGLSAQNTGRAGSVRCRIVHDGHELAAQESRGAFVVVTCTAVIP